jgi:putative DNA primase/helicase
MQLGKFDLTAWMVEHPEAQVFEPSRQRKLPLKPAPHPGRTRDAYAQAREWISHVKPAISGQGGSKHTYGVACALVKGFILSTSEAESLLSEWNASCSPPWTEEELAKKIADAEAAPDTQPRGWHLQNKKSAFSTIADIINNADQEEKPEEEQEPPSHSCMLDDPASIAIRFVESKMIEKNLCEYRWWNGQFYAWNGSHYTALAKEIIDTEIFWFVEKTFLESYIQECSNVPTEKVGTVKKKKLTNTAISNVKTGIINLINITGDNQSEPFWIQAPIRPDWEATEMISASNILVHVPSFIECKQFQIKKTPKYFSTSTLGYPLTLSKYDGPVDPPKIFGDFLESVWPDDLESRDALQEWLGCFSIPCTKYHKIFMMIGPPRSGKGTVIRIIDNMFGDKNIAYITFKSLSERFGLESLMGKTIAVFPDARITGRTDIGSAIESILAISGEDPQTIDRKGISKVTQRLKCRFIISSNLIPRLTEESKALVARSVVLNFKKSFVGVEDVELSKKLIPEIPDIFRWAIDGWKRLNERGYFLQPATAQCLLDDFESLTSPTSSFALDCLEFAPSYECNVNELFPLWQRWCQHRNRENTGDMDAFIRNLRATLPSIELSERTTGNGSTWGRRVLGVRPIGQDQLPGHSSEAAKGPYDWQHESWTPYKESD